MDDSPQKQGLLHGLLVGVVRSYRVAAYELCTGSQGPLIKLVAGAVVLNKENFELQNLFLTAFPKARLCHVLSKPF